MNIVPRAGLQHGQKKIRLAERFASGKGDSAAGLIEKRDIPFEGSQKVRNPDGPARALPCFHRTDLDAVTAVPAEVCVDADALGAARQGMGGAVFDAKPTPRASAWKIDLLGDLIRVLRIVTPPTVQRTAF